MAPRLRAVPSKVIPDKSFNLFKKLLILQRFCKMADKKKEASGSTGLEADVDACNISKNEMEWWHPARRFASDRCTNCGVELEQEDDSGANNNNSDSARPFANPTGGRGGCSRCHRAYYCGTEVRYCVVLPVCCGVASILIRGGFANLRNSVCAAMQHVNSFISRSSWTIISYATSNLHLPIMTMATSSYLPLIQ